MENNSLVIVKKNTMLLFTKSDAKAWFLPENIIVYIFSYDLYLHCREHHSLFALLCR